MGEWEGETRVYNTGAYYFAFGEESEEKKELREKTFGFPVIKKTLSVPTIKITTRRLIVYSAFIFKSFEVPLTYIKSFSGLLDSSFKATIFGNANYFIKLKFKDENGISVFFSSEKTAKDFHQALKRILTGKEKLEPAVIREPEKIETENNMIQKLANFFIAISIIIFLATFILPFLNLILAGREARYGKIFLHSSLIDSFPIIIILVFLAIILFSIAKGLSKRQATKKAN